MTLREQIKQIHAKYFSKEFHEYRGELVPAMIADLKMKFFDLLHDRGESWTIGGPDDPQDSEIRIIKHADKLIETCGLRENTPAYEP